jgi:hypothetical protein
VTPADFFQTLGLVGLVAVTVLAVLAVLYVERLVNGPDPFEPLTVNHRTTSAQDRAARLLQVQPDADPVVIRAAHRKLAQAAHPDAGGSNRRMEDLNRARDLLLGVGVRR